MDNLGSLCLIGCIIVGVALFALSMLPRMLMGGGGSGLFGGGMPGRRVRPQYDDPNISSRGAFGPSGGSSGGLFGRGASLPRRSRVRRTPGTSSRADSPNISSRGGFGRSKD